MKREGERRGRGQHGEANSSSVQHEKAVAASRAAITSLEVRGGGASSIGICTLHILCEIHQTTKKR